MAKILELRDLEEPVTVVNLAHRFGVSERTLYYILAQYRTAEYKVLSGGGTRH